MEETKIIRRIDDMGRVSIPKKIRKHLRLTEGMPMEVFADENSVTFKKVNSPKVIVKRYDNYEELVDFKGNVIASNYSLRPEEVLAALKINYEVKELLC